MKPRVVNLRILPSYLFSLVLITLSACQPQPQTMDLMAIAEDQRAEGAYSAAESLYTQHLSEVNDPAPALALADLYIAWNRPALGLAALDTAKARGIAANAVITRELTLLLLNRYWQPAAEAAEKILQDAPDNTLALRTRMTASLQLHHCIEAQETAERLYQVDQEDADAARTSGILGDHPTRICDSTPVLCQKADGCDGICYLDIGRYLIEHDDWALAACVLENAVTVDPDNAAAHAWLGETLSRLGQSQTAENHYMTAVALKPDYPLGWLLLGVHALQMGEWETARAALLNAQHLDPENPATCLTIAELKAAQSRYDEVETWVRAALERAPGDGEVWKAAVRMLLTRNLVQSDLPKWIAGSTVAMDPQDAEAHLLLGWATILEGNTDEALSEINLAIELDPGMGEAYYLHGILMEQSEDPEQAQEDFTRAADLGYFP